MGTIQHHAIVVTGWNEDSIEVAHETAKSMFDESMVSEISPEVVNGYRSFCVFPDGSKEWWPTSNENDDTRNRFTEFLKSKTACDWIEVSYGELGDSIVRTDEEE